MDLDAYRARAQDPSADPADLIGESAIDGLRDAAARGEPGARRLLRFAVEGRLRAATARPDAARAHAETEGGLAGLTAALAEEDDLVARVALEERRLDVVARGVTPPAAEALDRVRAEARALGWPSARAMFSATHGVDLGALAAEAEALLRATAAPALPDDAIARQDLPRVQRAAWADPLLPADPVAHLRATLARLGVEERFAVADLVDPPGAGLPALEALFGEAGRAAYLSHRDPAAPFEDRHLAEPAHLEAIALAFADLAIDPQPPQLATHRAAMATLRARRLAASLLHDLDLLDEGAHPSLRERYARRMAVATGLSWPSAPWLAAADPLLSSADGLRALSRMQDLHKAGLAETLTS